MRPAANGHEVDRSLDARVDYRPGRQAGDRDGEFGYQGHAESGLDHGLNPVIALAAVSDAQAEAARLALLADLIGELAIGAKQVALVRDVVELDARLLFQPMARRDGDQHALAEQLERMEPLLVDAVRQAEDGDVDLAGGEHVLQRLGRGVAQIDVDVGIAAMKAAHQVEQLARTDRAHDADAERRLPQLLEVARPRLGGFRLRQDLGQIGLHHPAELG